MAKIVISSTNIDEIFNIPEGKIRIINLETNKRELLHQYLETKYPKLHKTSLRCIHFNSERLHTFIKCYECKYKNVLIDEYQYGVMESNQDEYRTGDCPRCNNRIIFEPNYNSPDDVRIIWGNNIVAFGAWFLGYNKPRYSKTKNVSDEEMLKILLGKCLYEIPEPPLETYMGNKKYVSQYIDSELGVLLS